MTVTLRSLLLTALLGVPLLSYGQTEETQDEPTPTPATATPSGEPSRGPVGLDPHRLQTETTEPGPVQLGPEGELPEDLIDGAETLQTKRPSSAADASDQAADPQGLHDSLADITTRLELLESRLVTNAPQGADADLRRDLRLLTETVAKLSQSIDDNLASIDQLHQQLEEQRLVNQENSNRLQELAAAAAGTGESPTLWGNSQSSEASRNQHFENMRYRLRLHNNTGREQPLYVNGVLWSVRNEEWSFVPLPKGPVTVQRPGFDPIELAEGDIRWTADRRGFFIEYDLSTNGLPDPGT